VSGWICERCQRPVLLAVDQTTGERVVIDRDPVRSGRVEVLRVGMGLVAVDGITQPAPRQPAHELHSRTCTDPAPVAPVDLDDDPVKEQSGGWRR